MENEMKSKVMGVDAANRRKNAKMKVSGSGGSNPGANLKPESKMAPKSSKRPYTRTDKEIDDMADHSAKQGVKYQKAGGKVSKMAMGGMCRGMGAATKGGKYKG
jgi:hypothetical protein